jgi:hypothetical protein
MAIDSTAGGYWRQEDGTFIKIAEMETSEIVNLMQMLENRAKAREYCRCWSADEFSCGYLSTETLHERPCYQELKAELERRGKLAG